MNKLFEVPYNFDEALVKFYRKRMRRIRFLYVPPYKDDLINTRSSIQTSVKGHCYMPISRTEYEYHLRIITEAGLRFVILWQVPKDIISNQNLSYYSRLGCSGFIIANDKNAKIIKDYDPSLMVICSLVQKIDSNITKRDFQYYDYIIPYYTFNRSLDVLKQIQYLKHKIILMPNTLCNIDCPSMHHWFPSKRRPFDFSVDCWTRIDTLNRCGLIFPEHLKLFDDYVAGYKLQGREYPTEAIKYLCHFYFEREEYKDFITPFLREDMSTSLYKLAHSMPSNEYYNINSAKLLQSLGL